MSFSRLSSATIVMLFLVFVASASGQTENPALEKSTFIKAEMNKPFRIAVQSNPSTGYSWKVDFDESFLKLEDSRYIRPEQQTPGKGGQQIFVFLPLKSGQTNVEMHYKRPWETAPVEIKKYSISISAIR
jgi:predicted secreted protein